MTMKLICPKCKKEIEYVKEHAKEYRIYSWKIHTTHGDVYTFEDECYDSETQFFECEECGNHCEAIEDFIAEGD